MKVYWIRVSGDWWKGEAIDSTGRIGNITEHDGKYYWQILGSNAENLPQGQARTLQGAKKQARKHLLAS